jgi:hypothetical protein
LSWWFLDLAQVFVLSWKHSWHPLRDSNSSMNANPFTLELWFCLDRFGWNFIVSRKQLYSAHGYVKSHGIRNCSTWLKYINVGLPERTVSLVSKNLTEGLLYFLAWQCIVHSSFQTGSPSGANETVRITHSRKWFTGFEASFIPKKRAMLLYKV